MKVLKYRCENCGECNSHIDSYNDKYCYDCIDISTGKLKSDVKLTLSTDSKNKRGEK